MVSKMVVWRWKRYTVRQILDMTPMTNHWWEQEPESTLFRVETTDLGVYELGQIGQEWKLYRAWE